MALYTTAEANAAVITRSQPAVLPGATEDEARSAANHRHWCFVAKHANYKSHEWCDTDLAWNADAATLKAAVIAHLETVEAEPVVFKTRYDQALDTAGNPIAGQVVSDIT